MYKTKEDIPFKDPERYNSKIRTRFLQTYQQAWLNTPITT